MWDAIEADPATTVVVDVERLTVEVPGIGLDVPFDFDATTQRRFLDGLDDIGITMTYEADDHRLRGQTTRLAGVTPDIWGRSVPISLLGRFRAGV